MLKFISGEITCFFVIKQQFVSQL